MITISLCLIVKNEEKVLARCLESVKCAVDEIIIVDTGSSDKTKEIAGTYTNLVYDFEWVDDFGAARNYAYSLASMEYQMWMDADDILPTDSLEKLLQLKETLDNAVDIVTMKYLTHFDAQGNPVLSATRERLTKREKAYAWEGAVHECIPLLGKLYHSEIEIHHKKISDGGISMRNLEIYNKMEAFGKAFSPRHLYYYARELKDHCEWERASVYFEEFLNTGKGWVEDNIAACFNLSLCYRMMGDTEKVLPILTRSFLYDAPRAELCTEIGLHYKREKKYRTALKWLQIAGNLGKPDSIGFVLLDYWGYIPNIESCVCCCLLGDFENAKKYNEAAALYKPGAAAIETNRRFLASM